MKESIISKIRTPLPGNFNWSTKWSLFFLATLTIILLAPFATKAFHIDDPLFIWAAKHIQNHPENPYGFYVNWYDAKMGMWEVTKNPPLTCYYIAFIAFIFGWGESALHIAFLIPAIAAVLGTYFFARRLCSKPLLAGIMALGMPVFLISATTVMCDMMMLAFWTGAVVLWMRGLENNDHKILFLSSLLIALSALTKYFGISLLLLLPFYAMIKQRKIGSWLIYLAIPIIVLLGYQWQTYMLYGKGLLLDAGSFATEFRSHQETGRIMHGIIGIAFTGGCLSVILFYLSFLWSKKILIIQFLGLSMLVAGMACLPDIGSFQIHDVDGRKWSFIFQFSLALLAGANILILTATALWKSKMDADNLLLFCWIFGTFFFAAFVNWSINGRSILPMVPAVAVLLVRRIDGMNKSWKNSHILFWPAIPAICLSLLTVQGDFVLANSARDAAAKISSEYDHGAGKLWFQGHWGFQYYMELKGGEPSERNNLNLLPGDIVVIPQNNNYTFSLPEHISRKMIDIKEIPLKAVVSTMNKEAGSGFYSHLWGPLPFVLGRIPMERYGILGIDRGIP